MKVHIAIMRSSWGLTEKILNGEKIIESRWYKNRYQPWDNIETGEEIYFKNSGKPVTIKAKISKVLSFSNLNPNKVAKILKEYGSSDGLNLEKDYQKYYEMFKNKKYCLLVFLKDVQKIKPFNINKKGFGTMSSWLVIGGIDQIKV